MSYWNQKNEWKKKPENSRKELDVMINDIARSYVENPENIIELLEFNSQFYQYSIKNTMLIHHQNPGATFVQSYTNWKKMGVMINKGEKGIKIYRPEQATILKIGNRLVPYEQATKEEKLAYQTGEIDSTTKRYFRLDYVFDIAQTSFPKDKLPKYFFMGFSSEQHEAISKGLEEYAATELGCSVKSENLESISIRGMFRRETKEIMLNELLEDTQKLSTLSHELAHAIIHNEENGKSGAQKELEADALGIMLETHFGIEPTEARKRHLSGNFKAYQELSTKDSDMKGAGEILYNINSVFRKVIPVIEKYVENQTGISMNKNQMLERSINEIDASKEMEKKLLYEDIKTQIKILDYASTHFIELKRAGRYYTMKEHDSVRIAPEKNCFFRNSGIGTNTSGSVIDFAMEFVHNGDKHATLTELEGMLNGGSSINRAAPKHKSELPDVTAGVSANLPPKNKDMRRVYAYLIKSRYLDQDVVQEFIDQKMLYQDVRGNCVFVAYGEDKQPNYGTFRGTLTGKKFLGDVPGNDYSKGFYIDNGADKMIVAESVIDAMSIMSVLKGQEIDYHDYNYLALAGTGKIEPVLNHLQEKPMKEVLLSLDNDNAGVKSMGNITDLIRENVPETKVSYHVPKLNDWNEELSNAGKKLHPFSSISYLDNSELPDIHPCAIQSTESLQESGFRIRNGKHQYRLVELDTAGNIIPVASIAQNKIYYSPDEVKTLIPNLYELVPYQTLETLQQGIMEQQQMNLPILASSKVQEANVVTDDKKLFYAEDGVIMVYGEFEGEKLQGSIWKKTDAQFCVCTGYAFDDSYKEYLIERKDIQELENALGIDTSAFGEGYLYDVKLGNKNLDEVKQIVSAEKEKTGQKVVHAELGKQMVWPEPQTDMSIGIGS